MEPFPPERLDRRKQVHVRLRADLSIEPQKYEGRTFHVVKDPVSLRYYRFKDREYFLMRLMDGSHTLDEARVEYENQFRPHRLSLEEVEGFAQLLIKASLAQGDSRPAGRQLFEQLQQHRRRRRLQALRDILAIQVPVCDPDRMLGRMLVPLQWVFTPWFALVSAGVILAAFLLVATHFETFRDRWPAFHEFLNWNTLLSLWLALGVVKVIHELGHGLSCKVFGGEVHEMGVLFLCFSPCLYCDASDAWTLPNKWQRILISFAGIYTELIIAALATFGWWNTFSPSLLNHLCLCLMVVCSVNTVVLNANPLMRFDGYYVLSDWLEVPNLRERSGRFFKDLVLKHCLGVEAPRGPSMARWRGLLFVLYALAGSLYRWVLTFSILWFFYLLLEPHHLGVLGTLLAVAVVGSMLGRPLVHFFKGFYVQGRLPPMKASRTLVSAGVLGTVLLSAWLVPLPVSRIRETALVQLQPEAMEKVPVPAPAVLERLYVRDGQRVKQNDVLAEFRSLELENQREEARSEYDIRLVRLATLSEQAEGTTDPDQRARLEVARETVSGERDLFAGQVQLFDKLIKGLTLRAPRAGVVMGPPRLDEVGKLWHPDENTPFCTIGDVGRLRALMPVSPADYRLLKEELAQVSGPAVTVRVQGTRCRTGKLAPLPESEAKEMPFPLTMKGGGPVPAAPGEAPNTLVPQTQQYLVGIDFQDEGGAVYPGTLAQVKVHCRWRSCAWWLWRSLASTFDLGLI